jgi:1-acyl-sn-glycerol-3-phosphate acyltransferase
MSAALLTAKSLTWRLIMVFVHPLYTLVWPTRVRGRRNVPTRGRAVIVANHQSFLDIPLICKAAHHRHLAFVARASLANSKVLSFVMRECGAIQIDRDRGDRAALRRMIEVLQADGVVVIFPEGSRTRDGGLSRPKKGALMAARRAGAVIVPCALDGSFAAWKPGRRFPRPGRLRVTFGSAIDPESPDALEATWGVVGELLGPKSKEPALD